MATRDGHFLTLPDEDLPAPQRESPPDAVLGTPSQPDPAPALDDAEVIANQKLVAALHEQREGFPDLGDIITWRGAVLALLFVTGLYLTNLLPIPIALPLAIVLGFLVGGEWLAEKLRAPK